MSERRLKSQYIQYEDSLDYEEDYIEEESLHIDGEETSVEYPVVQTPNKARNSSKSNGYKYTSSYHVKKAEKALKTLKEVVKKPGWEKVLTHKSGVVIYSKPGLNNYDRTPVFMGEHIISGVSPQSVFAVVGMRKLWDEWYVEGNLVENLNDTISTTYMVMQAFSGSKTRDMTLVEKVECTQSGTIFFVATSIENPKVPDTDGKIRAEVKLNGWIFEPIFSSPPKTKVTYILQVHINGWVPPLIAKKYMMRRPLILSTIESYLKKNGPPPMIISTTPPPSRGISGRTSEVSNDSDNMDIRYLRKRRTPKDRREVSRMTSLKEIRLNPATTDEGPELSHLRNQQSLSAPTSPILPSPKEVSAHSQFPPILPSETGSDEHPEPKHTLVPLSPKRSVGSLLKQESPRILTHRHIESAHRAIATIKFLASNYDGWNLYIDNQGVKIYTRDVPDKSTPQVRGETIISGGFTPEDILSLIVSIDMRKFWDDRFEEGKMVERLGKDDVLSRICLKGTFPISGRDLATVSKVERDEETNTIWFAGTSVSDPLIPESKKHVRAELNVGGWRLRPIFDKLGKSNSVEVTYIVDIDIKLESVPSSILKSISTQTPMCVAKIDELIRKIGHPPYVRTSSGTVISEGLNTKTYQYDLTVGSVGGGGVTEIKISRLMYPSGFNIAIIPETSKVVLLSDKDVVRIRLPIGIEIETLNIKITKCNSENVQFTFNGEKIHVVHSEEAEEVEEFEQIVELKKKIVEPLLPQEISTHDNHDNDKTPTNAERNGYADEKAIIGHAPGSIADPNTFKSTEAQKAITPSAIAEEKNSKIVQGVQKIDYSIPKPDQLTKKYVPAPFFAFNATKYVPEPIFMQANVFTLPPSNTEQTTTSTPTHEQQKASRRISSRMLPIHMMNQAQFYGTDGESDGNGGISFFKTGDNMMLDRKEIIFSPQEASLMFAFMALAYYVGKFSVCGV